MVPRETLTGAVTFAAPGASTPAPYEGVVAPRPVMKTDAKSPGRARIKLAPGVPTPPRNKPFGWSSGRSAMPCEAYCAPAGALSEATGVICDTVTNVPGADWLSYIVLIRVGGQAPCAIRTSSSEPCRYPEQLSVPTLNVLELLFRVPLMDTVLVNDPLM